MIYFYVSVFANDYYVKLSHDGPVVLGGSITFRADVFGRDGSRPKLKFIYKWSDNAFNKHQYEVNIYFSKINSVSLCHNCDFHLKNIFE